MCHDSSGMVSTWKAVSRPQTVKESDRQGLIDFHRVALFERSTTSWRSRRQQAQQRHGTGDLDALFNQGDTWVVG